MHGASVQCNIVPVARQTATANRAPETLRAEPRAAREKQPKARRNSRATRGMSRARRSESSVAIAHCDRWRQVRGLHGGLQRCRAWADSKTRPRRGEGIVAEQRSSAEQRQSQASDLIAVDVNGEVLAISLDACAAFAQHRKRPRFNLAEYCCPNCGEKGHLDRDCKQPTSARSVERREAWEAGVFFGKEGTVPPPDGSRVNTKVAARIEVETAKVRAQLDMDDCKICGGRGG